MPLKLQLCSFKDFLSIFDVGIFFFSFWLGFSFLKCLVPLTFDLSDFIYNNARKPVLPTLFLLVVGTCEKLFSSIVGLKKVPSCLQAARSKLVKQDDLCSNYVRTFGLKHHYAQLVHWL